MCYGVADGIRRRDRSSDFIVGGHERLENLPPVIVEFKDQLFDLIAVVVRASLEKRCEEGLNLWYRTRTNAVADQYLDTTFEITADQNAPKLAIISGDLLVQALRLGCVDEFLKLLKTRFYLKRQLCTRKSFDSQSLTGFDRFEGGCSTVAGRHKVLVC